MNFLSLLIGWKGYALTAAGTALVVGSVATYVVHTIDNVDYLKLQNSIAEERANNADAALDQYTKQAQAINLSALKLLAALPEYNGKFDELQKELRRASTEKPLPPECRPSAERLRILRAAVAATNAAAFGQ